MTKIPLNHPKKQLSELVGIIDEKSGRAIISLDVSELTIIADYFLIATGTSERHLAGMAREIIKHCKSVFKRNPIVSGIEGSGWVLVDCGDIIVHLFREETRQRYNLEGLWQHAKKISHSKE